jgi:hypothetical protein
MAAPDGPPQRDEKGRLLPGFTANPKGVSGERHAVKRKIRAILEGLAPDAAAKLGELISDPDPKVALKVSCYVIDQVIGRPQTEVTQEEGKPTRVELTINGKSVRRIDATDPDDYPEEEAVQ